ncbi:fibronectin type III domain-containing protein [Curtobacterium sp. VKM Ac-1393]|uniref:fibronectin type III domain-containing protein n=1 Tax=Curtobacterium sp. VKM Ac-1393 TaxID=2783814 RepID=UPI00188D23A9|nr:fibronectin type III domain-containing protein [Curtobacterium sp. VKM Ac-1393]MBF4607544.1 fibronectin type III domain-containing protein [Curtobacterium sp. VKM Ac-1393]
MGTNAGTPGRVQRTSFAQGVAGLSMNDGSHYNADAQRRIGRGMFDALRRIATGASDPLLPAAPGQVAGLAATPSASSAAITWTATNLATAYAIEYRVAGSSTWVRAGSAAGSSYTLAGLTPNTAYEVRVSAMNTGGVGTPSAVASFTSSDVPAVTDSFNRADNPTTLGAAETGQAWTPNATVWGIVSGSASMLSGSNGRVTVESGRANGTVQAKFASLSTGSNHGRLLFRGDSSVNYWMVQLRVTGGVPGKYQLYKSVNGTLTQVGSDSAAAGVAGDVVKVVMASDSVTVAVNGATVITATDSFNSTATQHGLAAVGNGPTFKNFSVTA